MAKNTNYERPKSEVYQLLHQEVSLAGVHSHACIIGGQYDLYRYGKEAKDKGTFSSSGGTISLSYNKVIPTAGIVYTLDEDSIQLYAEGLLCKLVAEQEAISASYANGSYTELKAPEGKYWSVTSEADEDALAVTDGTNYYEVSIGDIIYDSDSKKYTKVVDLLPSKSDSTKFDTLRLADLLININSTSTVPTTASIIVCKEYNGVLENVQVTVSETSGITSVAYPAITSINVPQTSAGHDVLTATPVDGIGTIYPEYRVRVNYTNDTIISIDSISNLSKVLGTVDPANELAYACYCALSGGDGYSVYAVRTEGDTKEDFINAMRKTESNTNVYAFTPVTEDLEVMQAVVDFNEALSSPENKKWRITILGAPAAVGAEITKDPVGAALKGSTKTVDSETKTGFVQVSKANVDNGFTFTSYAPGDKVIFGTSELVITKVISDSTAQITFPQGYTDRSDAELKVQYQDTVGSNISYVSQVAQKFNNRRVVVVWCDDGRNTGKKIHNVYIAAEIAGMTSRFEPQAGMTNATVSTIDSAPKMYTKYSQAELDEIAAHGVLIITQNNNTETPYIRHQLTTCADKGILYSELSCTRNIDNISYGVADTIQGYVGRANVLPSALGSISVDLSVLWDSYLTNATDNLVGPQLYAYRDYSIQQDPLGLDRVLVNVTYDIPAPLNYIGVWQEVYVATITM